MSKKVMAENDDSRPFKVLRQNAQDFKSTFDADIKQILDNLDERLSELLRSPDNASVSGRLNAQMEFSKAKLDIFCYMKDMIGRMGEQWADHLTEIRETFVENVEIFLAGTKLEETSLSNGNRKSLPLNERKKLQNSPTPVSSLYPKLLDTAKNIPVLNSRLPKTNSQVRAGKDDVLTTSPVLKPIRKQFTPPAPENDSQGQGVRRKNSVRFAEIDTSEVMEVVEEEANGKIVEVPTPVKKKRGRPPSAANTPTSLGKAVAVRALQDEVLEATEKNIESPSRSGRGTRRSSVATPSSAKKSQATPVKGRRQVETTSDSSISGDEVVASKPGRGVKAEEDQPATPSSNAKGRRKVKSTSSEEVATPAQQTPGRRGRPPKRPASPQPVTETSDDDAEIETSKTGHFPHGLDLTEDLEIFSPVVNLTRITPRRKTVILQDLSFTPEVPKAKSKRKTIAGDLDFSSATPSKRLKGAGRASMASETMDVNDDSDHLEGDNTNAGGGTYTNWIPLSDIGGDVPTEPGVYELKVSNAKKPAYIGSCSSLRQQLTLHRLRHSSGHKHLDKFVDRNAANILARYERMPTLADAKAEEKLRVSSFTALYKTTPAYN